MIRPRLMVISTAPETLASFFVRQLAFLAEQGFEVHAVSSPGHELDPLKRLPGITVHEVTMRRRPHPLRDLASLIALVILMLRVRPGIVHAHTPKAGLLGMLAAAMARVPVRLYTIHGLPLVTRTGWLRKFLERAERLSCRLSTRTYCVSPSVEDVVRELRLACKRKVRTLGHGSCAGVDLERFRPREDDAERRGVRRQYAIPEDAPLLCYVGRIARDKGIAVLGDAWQRVEARFSQAHLLICGGYDPTDPPPAVAWDRLKARARVHVSADWVTDMPAIYAASDILVQPTFREGLPQVAIEAGAMGVPVVASRVVGMVNAVDDGVTGLLVPANDPEALAEAASRLVADALLRRRMGAEGRRFVAARFGEARVNNLYLAEYREFAGARNWTPALQTARGGNA
jgi:glycosyltransferase involved in cell wall biosynthesis